MRVFIPLPYDRIMRFDLHIHSCLSPCASLEMSPQAIARRAREVGLDGIALCDHNSARNAPAFAEVCAQAGLAALHGMEIATSEEVHLTTLFDTVEAALLMSDWVYTALPERLNQPEVFGDQAVVNADDTINAFEPRMLSTPTRWRLCEVVAESHRRGGLCIAAHADRPSFSVHSQLGVLAGDEGFDALEWTIHANRNACRKQLGDWPGLRGSDAHTLEAIGTVWNEATLSAFSVQAIQDALKAGGVRLFPA